MYYQLSSNLHFLSTLQRHPRSTLFPYTTLFRSHRSGNSAASACRPARPARPRTRAGHVGTRMPHVAPYFCPRITLNSSQTRSEEHTSELQSPVHLVCRLLLEKKKI